MNHIALKMLMGDRGKYIGIVMGLTFASLIMTQQPAIFLGLMTRTFSFISDVGLPDIWVMDSKVQFVDDIKPLQDTELYRVRGISGVEWAMPMYKGLLKARLADGTFQTCNVVGLDDATLIGGPPTMIEGSLEDLRRSDGVIVDIDGAKDKLGKPSPTPGGKPIPLKVGDNLELNDRRAIVVGISKVTRTFQAQPVIYTTYSRAKSYAPRERKLLSFVLVKAKAGQDLNELTRRIRATTGLAAYTQDEFKTLTYGYFMKNTGIPINFGISVLLGFIVGAAIAGQTFYNFTLDNLRQFGVLKAMGTSNWVLLKMILLQAILVGSIGYGMGVGLTALFGYSMRNTILAFRFPWQLLIFSGAGVSLICVFAAIISILKVIRLEPAIVFKG
jgi:putative ABC transport system permease protein